MRDGNEAATPPAPFPGWYQKGTAAAVFLRSLLIRPILQHQQSSGPHALFPPMVETHVGRWGLSFPALQVSSSSDTTPLMQGQHGWLWLDQPCRIFSLIVLPTLGLFAGNCAMQCRGLIPTFKDEHTGKPGKRIKDRGEEKADERDLLYCILSVHSQIACTWIQWNSDSKDVQNK